MHNHWSDLIAGAPFITGTVSGFILAVIGFNWTLTAVVAVSISVITMIGVGVVLRRRQQAQITTTANNFILK